MEEKKEMIANEANKLTHKLDQKMKENLLEVENDIICKFRDGERNNQLKKGDIYFNLTFLSPFQNNYAIYFFTEMFFTLNLRRSLRKT